MGSRHRELRRDVLRVQRVKNVKEFYDALLDYGRTRKRGFPLDISVLFF